MQVCPTFDGQNTIRVFTVLRKKNLIYRLQLFYKIVVDYYFKWCRWDPWNQGRVEQNLSLVKYWRHRIIETKCGADHYMQHEWGGKSSPHPKQTSVKSLNFFELCGVTLKESCSGHPVYEDIMIQHVGKNVIGSFGQLQAWLI